MKNHTEVRAAIAKRIFLADGKRPTLWPEYGEGSRWEAWVREDRIRAYILADKIIADLEAIGALQ